MKRFFIALLTVTGLLTLNSCVGWFFEQFDDKSVTYKWQIKNKTDRELSVKVEDFNVYSDNTSIRNRYNEMTLYQRYDSTSVVWRIYSLDEDTDFDILYNRPAKDIPSDNWEYTYIVFSLYESSDMKSPLAVFDSRSDDEKSRRFFEESNWSIDDQYSDKIWTYVLTAQDIQ